jgi:hypothetical protein
MMSSKIVATAVATLMLAGVAEAKGKHKKASKTAAATTVQCSGINSCKGSGSCKGADNSCKGTNACKGQGWTDAASEKECTDKGGKVVAMAAPAPAGEMKK